MVLVGYGIPQQFREWIIECIITVSYLISLNGGLHSFFRGQRGLRQSDPLSPLPFRLCLKVFSRSLKVVSKQPGFHYHPMCADIEITHLTYADDLLLFARGDESTIALIANCLRDFGDTASLKGNPLKSNIYCTGVDPRTKETLLQIIGFQQEAFLFCYLGIPLATEKLRISNYSILIIVWKLTFYPKHTLSYPGKLELVKIVLQGVECFYLSILPILDCVIDKLYDTCRSFIWSTKHPAISWATICLSKEEGDYEVRDLYAWNSALLCRTL